MTAAQPVLSVVIVVYNSADHIEECISSISADLRSYWAELVVVDNASPDDSVSLVLRSAPDARILPMKRNAGFAGGVNAGIAASRGRYVLLLNPDIVVPEHGLHHLIDWMDAHSYIDAASPLLVDLDGTPQTTDRAFASIGGTLLEASRLHKLIPATARAKIFRDAYATVGERLDAGWVPGSALVLKPETWHRAGPFDDSLFMYGEDIEWSWRVHRAGGKLGVCATTTFSHRTSSSAVKTWGQVATHRRRQAGVHHAYRLIYGRTRARLLALLIGVAQLIEAAVPQRTTASRRRALIEARIQFTLALQRSESTSQPDPG